MQSYLYATALIKNEKFNDSYSLEQLIDILMDQFLNQEKIPPIIHSVKIFITQKF